MKKSQTKVAVVSCMSNQPTESNQSREKTRGHLEVWRMRWYPIFVLIGLGLGFCIALITGGGADTVSGRLGGDYPAFYAAGQIIREGDWQNLYAAGRQQQIQENLVPGGGGQYLPFSYPPYFALVYAPFAALGYRLSYVLHTLLMVAALVVALRLIRPVSPYNKDHFLLVFVLALTFYPIGRAVIGGQNTTLSVLLISLLWRATDAGYPWVGGLCLGLLAYKPQFALPLLGLFLLAGYWRVWLGGTLTVVALYAVAAQMLGAAWGFHWFKYAQWFSNLDNAVNSANSVSWLGFFTAVLGPRSALTWPLGLFMMLTTAIVLVLAWWNAHLDLFSKIGLAATGIVLLSPHAMYYDMGLTLVTYAALLREGVGKRLLMAACVWGYSLTQLAAASLGFSPLFLLLVCTGVSAVCVLYGRSLITQLSGGPTSPGS